MKQCAICADDLNEMQQRLDSDHKSIASVTQHVELQDEDEDNQDFHPDPKERYDLSDLA